MASPLAKLPTQKADRLAAALRAALKKETDPRVRAWAEKLLAGEEGAEEVSPRNTATPGTSRGRGSDQLPGREVIGVNARQIIRETRPHINGRSPLLPSRVRSAHYPPPANALRRILRRSSDPAVQRLVLLFIADRPAPCPTTRGDHP